MNKSTNKVPPSNKGKNVTYAEHVASSSLQTSIHAPSKHTAAIIPVKLLLSQLNSTTDKGNTSYPVVDQAARDVIIKITKDLNEALHQLATVKTEFAQMKNRFDSIDNKLDHIVSFCNISASSSSTQNRPVLVNISVNPIIKSPTPIFQRNTFDSPVQRNIKLSHLNTQRSTQRLLATTPTQTLQQQSAVSSNNSNTVNCNEFASAMEKVDQLHNNFNTIPAQLANITTFLGGNNTQ